jgi:hypothetical protein
MSNLTSLEYILKLFEVSAEQLHIDYVKETPTRLQKWATKNKPPFVGLIDLTSTGALNDVQNNLITFDVSFVFVVSNERDPSTESKNTAEKEASKLALTFLQFVKNNEDVTVNGFTMSEFFRDNSYIGTGKGLSINLTLGDKDSYCDIFCNDSTKNIDCNS